MEENGSEEYTSNQASIYEISVEQNQGNKCHLKIKMIPFF